MKNFTRFLSLIIIMAIVFSFTGCLKYKSNILDVTSATTTEAAEITTAYQAPVTTQPVTNVYTTAPAVSEATTTASATETTTANSADTPTTVAQTADPTTWSKEEILAFATNAVNKTKGYTGNVSVKHKENVDLNITKAPGGDMANKVINKVVSGVLEPSDETLNFSGGKATNSKGDSFQLGLPNNGPFTLTIAGVETASAATSGNNTVVKIKLPSEMGSLTQAPVHNAASIGYLDASMLDLSGVTINYMNINYKGSEITFTVNPDGYLVSAHYTVPLEIKLEGKAFLVTAQIEAEAQQTEDWTFNW